jgi:hypothetical protein
MVRAVAQEEVLNRSKVRTAGILWHKSIANAMDGEEMPRDVGVRFQLLAEFDNVGIHGASVGK